MFTGTIYMGKNQTEISTIFDTAFDWLAVPDINCETCTGSKQNSSVSGYIKNKTLSNLTL